MKSDHRHELKTNELADWLAHSPEWVKENRTTLIAAGAVIVVAIVVYFAGFYRRDVVSLHRHERLTGLVSQLPAQKGGIAQAASEGTDESFALMTIANDLDEFAKSSSDDNMAALSLIKRGETLRSELHYRSSDVTREELAKQIAQAQDSYNKALERSANAPALAAMAQLGLGLCEEELGNFAAAADHYRKVTESADYDGTTAKAVAAHRLTTMEDYKSAVVFKAAPEPPAPKPEGASAPTIQIGPGATNDPIKIEVPGNDTTPAATPQGDGAATPAESPAEATEANVPGTS